LSKKADRHFLKGKEVKQLLADVSKRVKVDTQTFFGSKPNIEVVEDNGMKIFVFDGKPVLANADDVFFPTLLFDEALASFPKVVVDMGAVPHICWGADVMAPGIVCVEGEFDKNDVVFVVDVQHRKPIAVGLALFGSREIRNLKHGKTVKNIHYVGDKLWNLLKKLM
jgi:PUA domain protein